MRVALSSSNLEIELNLKIYYFIATEQARGYNIISRIFG